MPWAEIDRVLATSDRRVVRRHLDLHLERLEERLAQARTTLLRLETVLAPRRSSVDLASQTKEVPHE